MTVRFVFFFRTPAALVQSLIASFLEASHSLTPLSPIGRDTKRKPVGCMLPSTVRKLSAFQRASTMFINEDYFDTFEERIDFDTFDDLDAVREFEALVPLDTDTTDVGYVVGEDCPF
jgi:hypothetical protein